MQSSVSNLVQKRSFFFAQLDSKKLLSFWGHGTLLCNTYETMGHAIA